MELDFLSTASEVDLTKTFLGNQQANVDDFLEFEIYFDELIYPSMSELEHDDSIGATEKYIYSRLIQILTFLKDAAGTYSWTCCPFFLEIVRASPTHPPHIHSRMRVGDNIEEEWFLVYLLRYLSAQFPDLSISLRDADGELLLIEAANSIPGWLTPQNSTNRVFFRKGAVHILPRSIPTKQKRESQIALDSVTKPGRGLNSNEHQLTRKNSGSKNNVLSIYQALLALRSDQFGNYIAKPTIQRSIYRRAKAYEEIISEWMHRRLSSIEAPAIVSQSTSGKRFKSVCSKHRCYVAVPAPIAHLLVEFPHLVGVSLDHLPPQISLSKKNTSKATRMFDCSNLEVPIVLCPLNLNRCQYARLKQLTFRVPRNFSPAQWRQPSSENVAESETVHFSKYNYSRAIERGGKLCLGLYCAYAADGCKPDATLSFFWKQSAITNCVGDTATQLPTSLSTNSVNSMATTLDAFVDLLCKASTLRSARKENVTTSTRADISPWNVLASLSSLSRGQTTDAEPNVAECDLSEVRFCDVLDVAYESYVTQGYDNQAITSTASCECLCIDSFRHCHSDCISDDESWLEVSPDDVETIIAEKQREDLFKKLVREEISSMKKRECGSKVCDKSPDDIQSTEAVTLENDLDKMFLKFREFMQSTSDFSGVNKYSNKKEAISAEARSRLQETLPRDLLEFLDDYEVGENAESSSIESAEDSRLDSEDSIDEATYEATSDADEENLTIDEDMHKLLRAMDKELSTFEMKIANHGRQNLNMKSDIENSQITNDYTVASEESGIRFRTCQAMDVTDKELSDNLINSIKQSRIHTYSAEVDPFATILGNE